MTTDTRPGGRAPGDGGVTRWMVEPIAGGETYQITTCEDEGFVVIAETPDGCRDCAANARLIAAAPDLLAALKQADALIKNLWDAVPWGATFNLDIAALNEAPIAMKRAIARATGGDA